MEKRNDLRNPVSITAELLDSNSGIRTFIARDFSKTGAFLENTDPARPLPVVDTKIKLKFRWPQETRIPSVEVEAVVIRQTNDGIGVRFIIH